MTDQLVPETQTSEVPTPTSAAQEDKFDFDSQSNVPVRATFHAIAARHFPRHTDILVFFCDSMASPKTTKITAEGLSVTSKRTNIVNSASELEAGHFINLTCEFISCVEQLIIKGPDNELDTSDIEAMRKKREKYPELENLKTAAKAVLDWNWD